MAVAEHYPLLAGKAFQPDRAAGVDLVGGNADLGAEASVLSVDPGFAPDHLLTFQVSAPPRAAGARGLIQFYDELRVKLEAIPGVTHVGGSTHIPLGSTQVSSQLHVEGRDVPPADLPEVEMRRAVHDYFGTMRIPVRAGRVFTDEDRTAGEGLAVINEALLARVFPGESGQAVVGRRVQMGATLTANGWLRVIGVVGNVRHTSLEEAPEPAPAATAVGVAAHGAVKAQPSPAWSVVAGEVPGDSSRVGQSTPPFPRWSSMSAGSS